MVGRSDGRKPHLPNPVSIPFSSSLGKIVGRSRNRVPTIIPCPVLSNLKEEIWSDCRGILIATMVVAFRIERRHSTRPPNQSRQPLFWLMVGPCMPQ